ncbi:hypothetical protein CVS40_11079 [Lucilia cuprina]|nr:hypothetical protein CVS40_11079 [Lucilia cuprina]
MRRKRQQSSQLASSVTVDEEPMFFSMVQLDNVDEKAMAFTSQDSSVSAILFAIRANLLKDSPLMDRIACICFDKRCIHKFFRSSSDTFPDDNIDISRRSVECFISPNSMLRNNFFNCSSLESEKRSCSCCLSVSYIFVPRLRDSKMVVPSRKLEPFHSIVKAIQIFLLKLFIDMFVALVFGI